MQKLYHKPLEPTASSSLMERWPCFFLSCFSFFMSSPGRYVLEWSEMFWPLSVGKKLGSSSTNPQLKFTSTCRHYMCGVELEPGSWNAVNCSPFFFIFALVMWTSNGTCCEIRWDQSCQMKPHLRKAQTQTIASRPKQCTEGGEQHLAIYKAAHWLQIHYTTLCKHLHWQYLSIKTLLSGAGLYDGDSTHSCSSGLPIWIFLNSRR